MAFFGFSLATGAAVAFSILDAGRKQLSKAIEPVALTALLSLGSLPFLVAWSVGAGWSFQPSWWPMGLISVALQGAASFVLLIALRIAPLSRTIPFLALTPVLSGLSAWLGLGEVPSLIAAVGMLMVTGGAFVLATASGHGASQSFRIEKGSLLTCLVALLWSIGSVVDKAAMQVASSATHAVLVTGGITLVFGAATFIQPPSSPARSDSQVRKAILPIIAVSGLGALAMGLQLSALTFVPVSLVETIKRAVGGVASLIIGRIFFDERITSAAALAVLVMTAGTVLVLQ